MTGQATESLSCASNSTPRGVDPSAAHFLACVEALTAEIRITLDAITTNDLLTLTDSICRQEDICSQLAGMPQPAEVSPTRGNAAKAWAEVWGDFESRIEMAVDSLRHVSTEYALVLQTSSRSISLLTSLCRGYAGEVRSTISDRPSRHPGNLVRSTWSCEV